MNVVNREFEKQLNSLGGALNKNRVIIALSGGVDSVTLLHLLSKAGCKGILAHVNYGLRGNDSNLDEELVRQLAEKYHWELEILPASEAMAQHPNESTQMAARRIRYEWFNALLKKHTCEHVFLAHHADDQAETFFLQLLRGSGSEGLSGMEFKRAGYIRPLLNLTKAELMTYAIEHQLVWREDKSNTSRFYLRNAIRHSVLPALAQVQPNAGQMILESVGRLKSEQDQLNYFFQDWFSSHVNRTDTGFNVLKSSITPMPSPQFIVHELLKEYGFSWRFCGCIAENLTHTHVQTFLAGKHTARLDRLYLTVFLDVTHDLSDSQHSYPEIILSNYDEMPVDPGVETRNEAWLSTQKIHGELRLRKWQKGDYYWPSGMKGRKLLSDYFTDLKLLPEARENQWILTCGDDIVWIVNRRIDRRFAAERGEKDVLRVVIGGL